MFKPQKMKARITGCFVIFMLPFITLAQQVADWHITVEKQSITVHCNIAKGYHIYADNDAENGLEGLQLLSDNSDLTLTPRNQPAIVNDNIFHKSYKAYTGKLVFSGTITGDAPAILKLTLKGFAADTASFIPIEETKELVLDSSKAMAAIIQLPNLNLEHPVSDCGNTPQDLKSIWTIFLLGLAGGFIALFTPCVFPMIPLTVSYFIKDQEPVNGILYGFYILLIYVLVSVPFHVADGVNPQIFNAIATNTWVNLAFFIIFILFALSFFGWIDLLIPTFLTKTGGKKGIFFMALTLVLVSFSCTGPLLGTLLAGVISNGAWALTAGTAGFGLALGLPFALFAIFPHWLNKLPKSGGWLNTVKKILAFIELGFAFKFLSNADLTGGWGILKREVFIIIWITILLALAAYLLLQKQKGLKFAAPIALLFTAYVTLDFTGRNLPLLSGFPPPRSYSLLHPSEKVKPAVMNDFEQALALAKKQNKPVMIDFTGWACVNCRKMEEHVWSKPSVAATINNNYILVSLYVDDKTAGEKWAAFEAKHFGQVSQPLYVLMSPNGELLNHPVGYTPDVQAYNEWLQCGLNAFHNRDL